MEELNKPDPTKKFISDGLRTKTSDDQFDCEAECHDRLSEFHEFPKAHQEFLTQKGFFSKDGNIKLMREAHTKYLLRGLQKLSGGMICLDSSQTWIIYWIIHSLDLLDELPSDVSKYADYVGACQNERGGFGGSPYSMSHLAPSYSAVMSLAIMGDSALDIIDRGSYYRFLLSMKAENGGFHMHEHGEVDCRSAYCALATASMLNMLTPELTDGVVEFLQSCQTLEGGFGGEPENEGHGGYGFCAIASLALLGALDKIDFDAFVEWLTGCQMPVEGGFQGRTNKLVDGCYSFWQGAVFGILADYANIKLSFDQSIVSEIDETDGTIDSSIIPTEDDDEDATVSTGGQVYHQMGLQKYILHCCQDFNGGLQDKPEKGADFYHTCYVLSGLSVSQHYGSLLSVVLGDESNLLRPTDVLYNVNRHKATAAKERFMSCCSDHESLMALE
eukprot:TRINITY_DN5140_c1_g2_i1.p1 TRINITY_DN5140_c1_g2~~TRINITY_DN5140_c1_g2_i1.p1  ORF type:complete len:445 (+),score=132.66 TRINITY_DN5140_c1_g2_i1:1181-2515(+)